MERKKETSDFTDSLNFIKTLRVEPFVFLAVLSFFLKMSVSGQLTQDKICMTDYGEDRALCFNVTSTGSAGNEDLKDRILKKAAQYGLYGAYISTIPAVIYAMFLGAWTDKFPSGPKLIMLAASFGILLDLIIDLVIGIYFEIPTPYTLISNVPSTLVGGVFTLFTAIYAHAIKTTTRENVVLRFAVLEIMMGTAKPLASFLPSRMLNMTPWFFPEIIRNYVGVYTVTILFLIPAIVWAYFFIEDTPRASHDERDGTEHELKTLADDINVDDVKDPWYVPLKSIFDLQNVKTMFTVFLKSRPDNAHKLLWLVTFSQTIIMISGMGEGGIQYLFVQKHFNWTFEENGDVNTVNSILKIFVPMLLVPLLIKKLKMSIPMMGLIGAFLSIVALVVRGAFITEYGYYTSLGIRLPSSIAGTALGTFSTKLVSTDEIGSIMAFRSCLMAVTPLVSSMIYTNLFTATFNTHPGACFFLSAILFLPLFCLFAHLQIREMRRANSAKPMKGV